MVYKAVCAVYDVSMTKTSKTQDLALLARRADREYRKAHDPWFGKRRRAGEMGRNKSKAAQSARACDKGAWA